MMYFDAADADKSVWNSRHFCHIAVSMDMLDTASTFSEVLNLVFVKLVRSKTKFWQIVGRGTRLCLDVLAPGKHKEFLYLFDYCQNLEFFSQNPENTDGSVGESLGKRLYVPALTVDSLGRFIHLTSPNLESEVS